MSFGDVNLVATREFGAALGVQRVEANAVFVLILTAAHFLKRPVTPGSELEGSVDLRKGGGQQDFWGLAIVSAVARNAAVLRNGRHGAGGYTSV
jgi:hypothetical protein